MKTDEEYETTFNECPVCDSTDIEGTGITEADGDWCTNGVKCNTCKSEWDDVFTLSGFSLTFEGKEKSGA